MIQIPNLPNDDNFLVSRERGLLRCWEKKHGCERIANFLEQCKNNVYFYLVDKSPECKHLVEYSMFYRLIEKPIQQNSYSLLPYGEKLLKLSEKNSQEAEELIAQLLMGNLTTTEASWVKNIEYKKKLIYGFPEQDNNGKGEVYARFLFEIGVLDDPAYWFKEEGICWCRFTDLGKQVYINCIEYAKPVPDSNATAIMESLSLPIPENGSGAKSIVLNNSTFNMTQINAEKVESCQIITGADNNNNDLRRGVENA